MSRPYRKIIIRYVRFAPAFCRLFSCIPRVLTRVATATLSPSGSNNDILVTAKTAGVAGNSLTAAITVVDGGTSLTVTETSGAVTVSSGRNRRVAIAGQVTGEVIYTGFVFDAHIWEGSGWPTSGLRVSYVPSTQIRVFQRAGGVETARWQQESGVPAAMPLTAFSVPALSGTASTAVTVTTTASTAAQALALSQSSLSITLTNAPGSDGTGVLAVVSATPLTGGI